MKETLQEIFEKDSVLKSGIFVGNSLIPEMEVYGFIPYYNPSDFLSVNPEIAGLNMNMADISIMADRLCSAGNIHPIYKFVERQDAGLQPFKGILYTLYIPRFRENKDYKEYCRRRYSHYNAVQKLERVSLEGNIFYYTTIHNEYLFKNYLSTGPCAASECFLVICRHINSITGRLCYELFSPVDLYPITK